MTLVNITLDEDEQIVILKIADEVAADRGILTPWERIADKIRKARDSSLFEVYFPNTIDGDHRYTALAKVADDREAQSPEHTERTADASQDTR